MQTKAQKTIKRHQRQAKRTQAQTWADVEKLSEIVQAGVTTEFYQQAMGAIICLRRLKRKTQENAVMWKPADEMIQRLLQTRCQRLARWSTQASPSASRVTPAFRPQTESHRAAGLPLADAVFWVKPKPSARKK